MKGQWALGSACIGWLHRRIYTRIASYLNSVFGLRCYYASGALEPINAKNQSAWYFRWETVGE